MIKIGNKTTEHVDVSVNSEQGTFSIRSGEKGITFSRTPKKKSMQEIKEDTIRLEAYFIWEKTGRVLPATECWMLAKKKLGL